MVKWAPNGYGTDHPTHRRRTSLTTREGNRFFRLDDVRQMPAVRIFGNGCLTFMAKFSGYWNMFDPTNGYTPYRPRRLPFERLHRRYISTGDRYLVSLEHDPRRRL